MDYIKLNDLDCNKQEEMDLGGTSQGENKQGYYDAMSIAFYLMMFSY